MIKLIMFDIGNVLLKDTGNYNNNEVGKILSSVSYDSIYDANFETQLRNFSKEYNYDYTYLKEQLKNYFNTRYKLNITQAELGYLASRYKLGIASNFISIIWDSNFSTVKNYFDLVLISGAIEVEKPNKKFFDILIDEASYLGIFKNEILFIDDREENLQAARELGIHTINYDNEITTDSLVSVIENYLKRFDKITTTIERNNHAINATINKIAKRPINILKEKLERQNAATYNETTVGALPVYDVYNFKPTIPQDPIEKLKELEDDEEDLNISEEEKFFNEELMLSLSKMEVPFSKDDLYPVYILLSYGDSVIGKIITTATKSPYSHGSIAFDSRLKSLYSFTGAGFIKEYDYVYNKDYKEHGENKNYLKYSLYVLFVSEKQLKVMDKFLNELSSRTQQISYSLKGCINNFFKKETHDKDKFFCSQFVAELVKQANEKLLTKDSSLYTPYDLRKIKNVFHVQKGLFKHYDYKKTESLVAKIKEKILEKSIRNEGYFSKLKLTKNKDLIIKYKKLNYKEEFNKSHKLLKIYKTTNHLDGMKSEVAKLWSYYLIIEELYIQKGKNEPEYTKTKEYKDAVVAKAFILGDCKEYLDYILMKDRTFNFAEYYEESPYNKDVILITQKDIKAVLQFIKEILI